MGTSAMSGGVLLGMQALSNKVFNPSPDVELIKENQKLSTSLGEAMNRLHQEVRKSALATDVLVNAVQTGDVPTLIVKEAKAQRPVTTISSAKTTPPATATDLTPFSETTGSLALSIPDFAPSIWDINPEPRTSDKATQTPTEYTMIVPDNQRAHHDLYKHFSRSIYDPWWKPQAHLAVSNPYHLRLGLMARAILASLEAEHPPEARYPSAHEYDHAYGPRGYNQYQVIPQAERERLLGLAVVKGKVNTKKYGERLKEAASRSNSNRQLRGMSLPRARIDPWICQFCRRN